MRLNSYDLYPITSHHLIPHSGPLKSPSQTSTLSLIRGDHHPLSPTHPTPIPEPCILLRPKFDKITVTPAIKK